MLAPILFITTSKSSNWLLHNSQVQLAMHSALRLSLASTWQYHFSLHTSPTLRHYKISANCTALQLLPLNPHNTQALWFDSCTKLCCSTTSYYVALGTPLNYTWTCPSGPYEVEGYYGRKVCNEHILSSAPSHSQKAPKKHEHEIFL